MNSIIRVLLLAIVFSAVITGGGIALRQIEEPTSVAAAELEEEPLGFEKVDELPDAVIFYPEEEQEMEEAELIEENNDLIEARQRYEAITANPLTVILLNDQQSTVLPAERIAQFVTLNEETVSITIDKAAIHAYVEELAAEHDTVGKSIDFTTNAGEVIRPSMVTFGWKLNKNATTESIAAAILENTDHTASVTWSQKGVVFDSNEIGSSYVEIDLNTQHVWVYKNGEVVVSTDCVSGKAINGCATPTGLFYINFKQKDAILRGENYETPVSYWMPIYLGVGLHDASWRSAFGSDLYVRNGSHGCINLPPSEAASVYDNVYTGEPVIVYGGMNEEEAKNYIAEADAAAAEEAAAAEAEAPAEEAGAPAEGAETAEEGQTDAEGAAETGTGEASPAEGGETASGETAAQTDTSTENPEESTASETAETPAEEPAPQATEAAAGTEEPYEALFEELTANYETLGMSREDAEAAARADIEKVTAEAAGTAGQ